MRKLVGMGFLFILRMELTMKGVLKISVLCLMLLWLLGDNASAADIRSAIRHGLKDIGAEKGQTGLCVLTDATYVKVDGMTSEPLVDVIREETGCTVGQGNLLFFHRPVDYLLKIAIFRKDTEACMVISYDGKGVERKKYDFAGKTVAKSSFWTEADAPLAPDTKTIVYFAKAWAAGAPYDLFKCLEFHNHLCPGILSGYLIVQYIAKTYPLKKGEAYTWFAYPPWCKDDALQVLLDLTAGKKDLYARNLTESQKEELTFQNPAGLLTIWHAEKKTGKGIVFRFDWDKVRTKDRLRTVFHLLAYAEKPEKLVEVVKECRLTSEMMEKLKTAEPNPFTWLGLTK